MLTAQEKCSQGTTDCDTRKNMNSIDNVFKWVILDWIDDYGPSLKTESVEPSVSHPWIFGAAQTDQNTEKDNG